MILFKKRLSVYFKSMVLLVVLTFVVPEATQSHLSFLAPRSSVKQPKKRLKQPFKKEMDRLENLSTKEIKTTEEFDQLANSILNEREKDSYFAVIAFSIIFNKAPNDFLKERWFQEFSKIFPQMTKSHRHHLFNLPKKASKSFEEKKSEERAKATETRHTQPQVKQETMPTELELFLEGLETIAKLEFNSLTQSKSITDKKLIQLERENFNGDDQTLPKYATVIFKNDNPSNKVFSTIEPQDKKTKSKKFGLVMQTPNNGKPKKMIVQFHCINPNDTAFLQLYTVTESDQLMFEELLIGQNLSVTFKNSRQEETTLLLRKTTGILSFYRKTVEINLPQLAEILNGKSQVLSPFYEGKPKDKFEKITEKIKKQNATPITLSATAWPLAWLLDQIEFSSVLFYIVTFVVLYFLFLFVSNLSKSIGDRWSLLSLFKSYNFLKEEPFFSIEDPFDLDTDTDIDTEETPNPIPLENKLAPAAVIATAL